MNRFLTALLLTCTATPLVLAQSGVGISLRMQDDHIAIASVVSDGPAAASNEIGAGDLLTGIAEGTGPMKTTWKKSLGEVEKMLQGEDGSEVRLEIVPANNSYVKSKIIALTRKGEAKPATPQPKVARGMIKNGTDAPDVSFTNLANDADEKLSDYKGKVVVMMFWASWFPGSHDHVESLQALPEEQAGWKEKVELLAFSCDRRKSSAAKLVKNKEWKIHAVWGESRKTYNPKNMVPSLYIVDAEGKIAASGHPDDMNIAAIVNGLLEE